MNELSKEVRHRQAKRRMRKQLTNVLQSVVDLEHMRLFQKLLSKSVQVCPICLENVDKHAAVITLCGHVFHADCILEWHFWSSHPSTCPSCRMEDLYWFSVADMKNFFMSTLDLLSRTLIHHECTRVNIWRSTFHADYYRNFCQGSVHAIIALCPLRLMNQDRYGFWNVMNMRT